MRIALFSDIHANLPALESCLENIEQQKPDVIYCLGDLVGYNVWPNEVINEIRKRKIPAIAGNYDRGIGMNIDDCGCAYKTDAEKNMGKISISYTNAIIKPEEREYLRTLPAHIRLEFQINDERFNLLLVHGSPRRINEYLFEDRDEKSFLRIMREAEADILCFGHTHKPYHKIVTDNSAEKTRYRHAINIGSVGKPKDNNPQGCFVILNIDQNISATASDCLTVEFIRFDYDIDKAARAIEESDLPDEYARMLRRGV
ncbi:MAG: metallophosphoesterase family protein [Flavisolibacter sp.]